MTIEELQTENARLKVRVSDLECDAETRYRQSMDDEYEIEWLNKITHGLMKEKEKLQAEVERLTKAGDLLAVHYTALSKCVTPNNAKSGSINDWTSVIDWNAAKEGKPQP
jgi:hypothetical protein